MTSEARSKVMPEVPTMLESKLAPMSVSTWYSIMAPKGVPAAVRQPNQHRSGRNS